MRTCIHAWLKAFLAHVCAIYLIKSLLSVQNLLDEVSDICYVTAASNEQIYIQLMVYL